jgi:tetratricopeptide (TPR) repeat protein
MSVKDWTSQQCYDRALKLIEAEKFDKARKLLQLARIKDPANGQVGQALAIVDDLIAKAAEAEASSGEMNEEQLDAAYEDVQAHIAAGELDEAARMIQVVVSINPQKRFRALQGQVNERKAAMASGVDFEAQVRLREVLADQDYGKAEQLVREQLRDNRSNPVLQWQLAVVLYVGMENPEQALGAIREALRLAPDRTELLALGEDVERALGNEAEAEELKARLVKAADGNDSEMELARMKAKEFAHKSDVAEHRPTITVNVDVQVRERRRMIWLLGTLVLLGGLGVWYYISQQPTVLDISPYSNVIAVNEAIETPKNMLAINRDELELRVDASSWTGLGEGICEARSDEDGNSLPPSSRCKDAREAVLHDLIYIAADNGYRLLVLRDETGTLLGSTRVVEETGAVMVHLP